MTIPNGTGILKTYNNYIKPILLEWEIIDSNPERLNEKIRNAHTLFVHTYTQQELDFSRKHPDAVSQEYFLKTLAPLFNTNLENINWKKIEEEINTTLQNFFATTDFAQFVDIGDTSIFIEAINPKTGNLLGAIQFLISPKFEPNHIRAGYFGIASNAQNCGIEVLLMSSIFAIVPETKRIFLHTRASNTPLLNLLHQMEFTQFAGNSLQWPDLEYIADKVTILQDIARKFTP